MACVEFDTISDKDPLYEAYAIIYVHPLICQQKEAFSSLHKTENIKSDLNEVWEKYWQDNGEQIVLGTWVSKYGDYVDFNCMPNSLTLHQQNLRDEKISEKELFLQLSKLSEMLNDISISGEKNSEDGDDWQMLWVEHYEEQYYLNYKIFSKIYNDLKSKLSPNTAQDSTFDSESYLYINSSSESEDEESKQMSSLGLPAAFGKRNNKKRKQSLWEQQVYPKAIRTGNYLKDGKKTESNFNNEMCTKDGASKEMINNEASSVQKDQTVGKENTEHNAKIIPPDIAKDKIMIKYWQKRFTLFSRFDEGIKLDRESWFSVTPEKIAKHLANRFKCDVIIDAFCGSGGNTIQFANTCKRVIGIDIDPNKIEIAKHNAKVYGVDKKIDFVVADFLHIYKNLRADVIFLSPPWGGPNYNKKLSYDVERQLIPVSASQLLNRSKEVAQTVVIYLPRNSNIQQLVQIAGKGNRVEIERNYLENREIALTAIYGDLINF